MQRCDQSGREQCQGKPPAWLKGGEATHLIWDGTGLWDNCLRAQMRSDQQEGFSGLEATMGNSDATETLQGKLVLAKKTSDVFLNSLR